VRVLVVRDGWRCCSRAGAAATTPAFAELEFNENSFESCKGAMLVAKAR
jgi:hypothetical protein